MDISFCICTKEDLLLVYARVCTWITWHVKFNGSDELLSVLPKMKIESKDKKPYLVKTCFYLKINELYMENNSCLLIRVG